ncbi:MAG: hypothetical protein WCG36_04975 [bacterium]
MLKAIVSYSKKIPVPDAEFSSQGFSLSLETEITERDQSGIQARLHETFELVKASVEQELVRQSEPTAASPAPAGSKPAAPEQASNKQIKFLTDLCQQKGIALAQLNQQIRQQYGVGGLYDLTRKQASELLDELNGKRRKAA